MKNVSRIVMTANQAKMPGGGKEIPTMSAITRASSLKHDVSILQNIRIFSPVAAREETKRRLTRAVARAIWARASSFWLAQEQKAEPHVNSGSHVFKPRSQSGSTTPQTVQQRTPTPKPSLLDIAAHNLYVSLWYGLWQTAWQLADSNPDAARAFLDALRQGGVDVDGMNDLFGNPLTKEPGEPLLPKDVGLWPSDLDEILKNSPDPYKDMSDTDLLNLAVYQDPVPPDPPPDAPLALNTLNNPQDQQDQEAWAQFFGVASGSEGSDGGGGEIAGDDSNAKKTEQEGIPSDD